MKEMGEEAFAAVWEEGRAMTQEQIIAYTKGEEEIPWEDPSKSFNQKTKA